jgi:hypothetical protein
MTGLGVNFFEDAKQGFGSIGADDITVGFDVGPLTVNMGYKDNASAGMALAKKPGGLPGGA